MDESFDDAGEKEEEQEKQTGSGDVSFFSDRKAVLAFVESCSSDKWEMSFQEFERITSMLGKYQEQPQLLSPHLHEMLSPMTTRILEMISSPTADDPTISPLQKSDEPQFHALCKIIQLCCRVRGYKHVMKLFPHEVSHLELCLSLIRAQDSTDYETWETRYVLLMWLCILCLIPFDICSMDRYVLYIYLYLRFSIYPIPDLSCSIYLNEQFIVQSFCFRTSSARSTEQV